MRILITAPNSFTGDDLRIGSYYHVEQDDSGTLLQNSLFHALLAIYYNSGCYSYPAKTYDELKIEVKKSLGTGYERYVYIQQTERGLKKGSVKRREDAPKNLAVDEDGKEMVWGVLKSWSDYSKTQRTSTIRNLITEMINNNVHNRRFYEILNQLERNGVEKQIAA